VSAPALAIQTPQETVDLSALGDVWQTADDLGYTAAFTFDHLVPLHPGERPGSHHIGPRQGVQLDGWMTAAVLAGRTSRLQVGTLVSGVTYRPLIALAKSAVTLDHASGGRAVLGVGAGWNREEHMMFGLPFPPAAQRLAMLEETIEAFRLLCTESAVDYVGTHVTLQGAMFEPKPVRPTGIPVLVGGSSDRVLGIAGRCADIYNGFAPPEVWPEVHGHLDAAAAAVGRDSREVHRSAFVRAELTGDGHRADALIAEVAQTRAEPIEAASRRVLTGSVEQIALGLAGFTDAGVETVVISAGDSLTPGGLARLAEARSQLAERVS
jgi:alkanesulfonate monooxygenase SsuD/methylene tetrahydromethanopterin reductase-like flavin-dependent oxidoreductase (luciferase family)